MLASGSQLGPYQITAPLGAGGMGEVYRAKDSRLDREVAIKVLPEQFASNRDRLVRFEREAKAVAALSHPNILAIHDYGTDQGQTFAVMELLEGESLQASLSRGALPWRKAVEIALAVADGLVAAHAKGIIHRDLKPDNIFLTAGGHVKILDFGLARTAPAAASGDTPTGTYHPNQTEAGAILGTVGYMSPEQVRGREVDATSDLFSLGCVLYEMLSGQRAFARDSAVESMAAILHDEPPELSGSGNTVPLELSRVVAHCLEKNPAARFHSAHDLAFALKAILGDSTISTRPVAASGAARPSKVLWLAAACALFAALLIAGLLVVPKSRLFATKSGPGTLAPAFASLAILPLANVTRDPQCESLCEGLAEHLSGRLSQVGGLKVRPITSTMHFRDKSVDAKTVGRELDVKAVVTGRLRQENENLVIAIELVDARDNSLVWTNQYRGTRQRILDLQDDLARDLAAKLGLRLTDDEHKRLTKHDTADPEAYSLYREGVFHFNKFTPDALAIAMEYFDRALKKDPKYAAALAGKARCLILLGSIHWGPKETHPEARKLVEAALEMDETLVEAHAALGVIHLFHDWDWPAAERELKRAIAGSAWMSHNIYGFWLAAHDRLPEALASTQRAQEIDPLAAPRRAELAQCYVWMRKYDPAIAEAQKALQLDSNFFMAYGHLGIAYALSERHQEAITELQKAPNVFKGNPRVLGPLGFAYAVGGQRPQAQGVLDALKDPAKMRYGCAFAVARIHAALGEKDQAFEWLRKACEERDPFVIWLKVDPTLDNLRSDQRFDAILQEMRLSAKPTPTRSVSKGNAS